MTPEEKNRLIAEKVLGWYWNNIEHWWEPDKEKKTLNDIVFPFEYDPYHHIEQAMEAVEKICSDRLLTMHFWTEPSGTCICEFGSGVVLAGMGKADTPSAAIVDAIVEVVGRRHD